MAENKVYDSMEEAKAAAEAEAAQAAEETEENVFEQPAEDPSESLKAQVEAFNAKFEEFKAEAPELSFEEDPAVTTNDVVDVNADTANSIVEQQRAAALTDKERAQINAFVDKIDLTNSNAIMNYGVGTQKKIADFSEKALENVRTKDLGEVGNMITSLVTELRHFDDDEEKKGLAALFSKKQDKVTALKAKYNKVENNVTAIKTELEKRQVELMKDSALLDHMYDMNLNYYKELTMYILAGKQKLDLVKTTELAELEAKAERSGLPEDAQAAKDMAALIERFEKKIHDLELTRAVAMQTGPQIRMVQASDNVMAEKIQSTIVNTIPLWKNQMVIAMGVEHSMQAAKAQREVTDMTNELLQHNADALKIATVESAKEAERGIVDIETLRHTNEALISTLDEVMQIQTEGKAKRIAAEQELAAIEEQLKVKLLQAARTEANLHKPDETDPGVNNMNFD